MLGFFLFDPFLSKATGKVAIGPNAVTWVAFLKLPGLCPQQLKSGPPGRPHSEVCDTGAGEMMQRGKR